MSACDWSVLILGVFGVLIVSRNLRVLVLARSVFSQVLRGKVGLWFLVVALTLVLLIFGCIYYRRKPDDYSNASASVVNNYLDYVESFIRSPEWLTPERIDNCVETLTNAGQTKQVRVLRRLLRKETTLVGDLDSLANRVRDRNARNLPISKLDIAKINHGMVDLWHVRTKLHGFLM